MKPSLRFEVFKRDNFICRYCGKRSPEAILEVDHITPASVGGTDEIENLVTACYECNRGKGARLLSDVPPESDLHEKAVLIAEQERQLAEYNYWRTQQREREDGEARELYGMWHARWEEHMYHDYWQDSNVRLFLRKLGFHEVRDILEYVNEHSKSYQGQGRVASAWRMFCGICWHRIKNPQDQE